MTDIDNSHPITPAVFHILLSLAIAEKHGYEIMKQVKNNSNGRVKMGNGTLYGSLKRMLADKLIEDAGEKTNEDNVRRKYYKLTTLGRKTLLAETQRYIDTVKVIQVNKLIPSLIRLSI